MNENFESLFENSEYSKTIKKGQLIEASVIEITDDHAVLNAGLKSESFVGLNQFKNPGGDIEIQVGDNVEVVIEEIENGDGTTRLSRQKAKNETTWANIINAMNEDEIIEGYIQTRVKGGFTVLIDQINAFLPGSLVDIRPVRDTQYLEGTVSEFKIIKAERKTNNIVVSRKGALQGDTLENKSEIISKLTEGQIIEGIVKNLTDYGAFIDLGGLDGLLHITDIAWKKIKHPSEILSMADKVKVKIISIDREKFRVSLGLKQLDEDPWKKIISKHQIGNKIDCMISNITDYGLFVEIEEGIEGLVHVSEINWTNSNPNPYKIANIGDQVTVMILDIDNEKRRVSLGIKQCKDNPWQSFAENNSIGNKIIGKIKSITDFGIFVELDGEIDGLIHISDISWNDEDNIDLSQFKKSDEIETSILSIEANRQRISLGIKQLNTDVFLEFNQSNPRGSIIKGIVSEVDERNAVILINKEIKGILNISEVSRDKVEDMRTIFKQNDEIEAKIIGSDRKSRTLKLSIKAKEEKEEREAIDSYKADEKKSISKTSLGELLKSKFKKD